MVVVGGDAVGGEVLLGSAGVVDVGHEEVAHFVAVLQQHMHSVVVLDELGQPVGEGVGGFGSLVDPVACVEGGVLVWSLVPL